MAARNAWVLKFGRRGNSNGVTIPRSATRALKWHPGDIVVLAIKDGIAVLTPFRQHSVAVMNMGTGNPRSGAAHAEG